jgi:hypothetical protein
MYRGEAVRYTGREVVRDGSRNSLGAQAAILR